MKYGHQMQHNWEEENAKLKNELSELKNKLASLEKYYQEQQQSTTISSKLFDSLPALIYWKDNHHKLLGYNKESETIEPFLKEDLKEKIEIASEDEDELLTGHSEKSESLFTIDHSWFYNIKVPIKNDQKEIIGLAGISNPINLPEYTDEIIQEKEQIISELLRATPDMIIIYDIVHEALLYMNRAESLFGYSIEKLLAIQNESIYNLVHPDDMPILLERNKQLKTASDNEVFEREYRIKSNTGEWRWLYSRCRIFKRNSDGSVWQYLAIASDITEKKLAEEELRKSEERYRRLILTTSDLITKLSPEGIIIDITPSCERILGYKPEELIGKKVFEFYHPEDVPTIIESFKKLGLPEQPRNTIGRARKKSGEYIWLDNYGQVVINEKGEISEIDISSSDISKRVEVEQKLKEAQHFAQQIADYTPDAIQIYDLEEQRNIYVNRQTSKITGWEEDHYRKLGQNFYTNSVHPDDLSMVLKRLETIKSLRDGEVSEIEFRVRFKSGEYHWARSRAVVFQRDKDGKVKQFISLLSDITEEKSAKEKLVQLNTELETRIDQATKEIRKSEEKYKALSELIPILVWAADEEGNGVYFNSNWYKYTGQSAEEVTGNGWIKAIHPEDIPIMLAEKEKAIRGHQLYILEYRIRRYDGNYRWHVARALPFSDSNDNTIKWFGTSTDIHDKKLAEEELLRKNEQLIRINNDLDNFIYTASHDLKAPVSNIEGLVEAANELSSTYPESEDLQHLLQMMKTSIDRFKNTLFELTEISKVQKDGTEDIEEINLKEMINEVEDSLDVLLYDTFAIIKKKIPDKLIVKFSRKNLRSILYNLISNAIKYRHPARQPRIKVKGEIKDNFVVISVKDNGLGLKPGYESKIFSMFKRFHTHVEGTGVGLYIVKRIIDNAGGKIKVHSVQGLGTEFKVYLPIGRQ